MGVLFLGIETKPRENWEKIFKPCVATRSSKPDSVAKEIAEKEAQRKAEAATTPFLATVTKAVLLDVAGAPVFETTRDEDASACALEFMAGMAMLTNPAPWSHWLFCFDARNVIRSMFLDALRTPGQSDRTRGDYWLRSSLAPVPWVDPCDVFINTALQHDIGLGGLCRFLEIPHAHGDELPPTSRERAELAHAIASKGKLFSR